MLCDNRILKLIQVIIITNAARAKMLEVTSDKFDGMEPLIA
jgi:hypothetical protein